MKRDKWDAYLEALIRQAVTEWDCERLEASIREAVKKVADKRYAFRQDAFKRDYGNRV